MRISTLKAGALSLFVGAFLAVGAATATAAGSWALYSSTFYTSKSSCDIRAAALNLQAIGEGRNVEYQCFQNAYVNPPVYGVYWRNR
ncbi:hypothetical protein ACIO8H_34885 [Streptomyces sp. NPDC087226]|jgi:hypothetical protein|uniref:hypothetical protein n=1 Tax=Streptomyces sp. NPDC087226 TaxID=3365771 RepID=UPI00382FD75C